MPSISPEVVLHNPVIPGDAPDPAVVRDRYGHYHLWSTQSCQPGRMMNMPHYVSEDLQQWHGPDEALPQRPAFSAETTQTFAPHVTRRHDGLVVAHLASGIDPERGQGHLLTVATALSFNQPLQTLENILAGGDEEGFRHIDPYFEYLAGKQYLVWGSAGSPIMMQELAPDLLQFAKGSVRKEIFQPLPEFGRGVVEAAWIVYDRYAPADRRYVLYFSFGDCFGDVDEYKMGVAISREATGPYCFQGLALENTAAWTNAGHHGFVTDEMGRVIQDRDDQMLAMIHAIPTEEVRRHAHSFMPRPVMAVPFVREELPFGRKGLHKGQLLETAVVSKEWVPGRRRGEVSETLRHVWVGGAEIGRSSTGGEEMPEREDKVAGGVPSIAAAMLGLVGEEQLVVFSSFPAAGT